MVIIYINFAKLYLSMLHAKLQDYLTSDCVEDVKGFLPYIDMGLSCSSRPYIYKCLPPSQGGSA